MFKSIIFLVFFSSPTLVMSFDLLDEKQNSKMAKVVVIINEGDRSESNPEGQSLKIYQSGVFLKQFDVSTASKKLKIPTVGKQYISSTPHGFYRIKRLYNEYTSYMFYGSDMQYAMFFNNGIAMHASEYTELLGHRASGGCVRLQKTAADFINKIILSTGNLSHETISEDFCNSKGENCYKRTLHLNRIHLADVHPKTGEFLDQLVWTYDAVVIVTPGLKEKKIKSQKKNQGQKQNQNQVKTASKLKVDIEINFYTED